MLVDHFNTTLELLQDRYPDYISYVPEAFFQDQPVSRWITFFLAFIFTILMVLSVGGNALMVICYAKYPDVRSSSNKLVINLSVSDSIMHLKSLVLIINGFYGGPILGGIGCILFASLGAGSGLSAIWTITAISYERCLAISSPMSSNMRLFPGRTVNMIILGIWTVALGFSFGPMIGIGRYVSEPYLLSCTSFDVWNYDKSNVIYIVTLVIMAWFIPLLTITKCYSKIMSYTRGTKALIRQATASDFYEQSSVSNVDANPQGPVTEKKAAVNREAERRTEKTLAHKLLIIIIVWVLAWTPFAVITMMQFAGYSQYVNNVVALIAMVGCKMSSVINSFLYGLRLPKFRKRILQLLSWLPCVEEKAKGIDRRPMQTNSRRVEGNPKSGEEYLPYSVEGHSGVLKHRDLSKANSASSEPAHARVEFKADCHQDGFQLQELACPKNEAVPFDFQLLERKAKASCGIGNQVNAPWLD